MLLSDHRKLLATSFERKETIERAKGNSSVHWTEKECLGLEKPWGRSWDTGAHFPCELHYSKIMDEILVTTGDFILRCLVSLISLSSVCMCVYTHIYVQRSMNNWIFCARHNWNIKIFSYLHLLSLKIFTIYKIKLVGISNNSSLFSLISPIFSSFFQCSLILCLIHLLCDCSIIRY